MTVFVKSAQVFEGVQWSGDNAYELDAFLNKPGKPKQFYLGKDYPYPKCKENGFTFRDEDALIFNSHKGGWEVIQQGVIVVESDSGELFTVRNDGIDNYTTLQEHMENLKPYLQKDAEERRKMKTLDKPKITNSEPVNDVAPTCDCGKGDKAPKYHNVGCPVYKKHWNEEWGSKPKPPRKQNTPPKKSIWRCTCGRGDQAPEHHTVTCPIGEAYLEEQIAKKEQKRECDCKAQNQEEPRTHSLVCAIYEGEDLEIKACWKMHKHRAHYWVDKSNNESCEWRCTGIF